MGRELGEEQGMPAWFLVQGFVADLRQTLVIKQQPVSDGLTQSDP